MPQFHNRPALRERRRALRNGSTRAERALWTVLKGRRLAGAKFRRQHSVGPFVLDFFCPAARLAVEVDGGVHADPARADYDGGRQRWLEARGIRVVRVTNAEVLQTPDIVAERILSALGMPPEGTGGPRR